MGDQRQPIWSRQNANRKQLTSCLKPRSDCRPCRYGNACRFLKQGRCRFSHPAGTTDCVADHPRLEDLIYINNPKQNKKGTHDSISANGKVADTQKKVNFTGPTQNVLIPSKEEVRESASNELWWKQEDYIRFRKHEQSCSPNRRGTLSSTSEEENDKKHFSYTPENESLQACAREAKRTLPFTHQQQVQQGVGEFSLFSQPWPDEKAAAFNQPPSSILDKNTVADGRYYYGGNEQGWEIYYFPVVMPASSSK
mmetsp:Transcript_3421/g.6999  ORF Transcript_3421/g.6999 Transcript_3421/m.6999 type:complete len:253 (-) Transcript_3421:481-1239(-)